MSRNPDLKQCSERELLRLHAAIIDELKRRGVVRTRNSPIGDYTEWLVSTTLGLKLANYSAAGYNATDAAGTRFQIKGRWVTPDSNSRQLSAIRNLDKKDFDYLIAVIFDAAFNVIEAVRIPHKTVEKYAAYRKHVNAHILHVRDDLLKDPQVETIAKLKAAQ